MKNRKSKSHKKQQQKHCDNCENCQYLGEGDYACMAGDPVIIKEEHVPNDNYYFCQGKRWERQGW